MVFGLDMGIRDHILTGHRQEIKYMDWVFVEVIVYYQDMCRTDGMLNGPVWRRWCTDGTLIVEMVY